MGGTGRSERDDRENDYFTSDHSSTSTKHTSTSSSIHKPSYSHSSPATERSPLLLRDTTDPPPPPPQQWPSHQTLTLLLMLVVVLAGAGDQLMDSPQTRIIESVICYRYYEATDPRQILLGRDAVGPGAIGGVAEMACKADAVQEQLAMLRGYQQLFDGFPALLLAIPFGWAADKYGRKPFLVLGLASYVFRAGCIQTVTWFWQAFDVRLTWLSTFHGLLGGSTPVVSGLFFVVLSDITPEAERAAVFLRVGACNLLANLFMPPLSAWLMEYNPWIPSLGGTLINILCVALFAFVPETLNYQRHPCGSPSYSHPPTPSSSETAVAAPPPPPDPSGAHPPISADSAATHYIRRLKAATAFLTHDWRVPALILTFLNHQLLTTATPLLLQYASKRYHLTFSRATLLLTIFNAFKVLLLFLLLPYISTTLTRGRFRLSDQHKDLHLARASQLFVAAGWTLVGLAPNVAAVAIAMAVASLGQGAYLLIRSFLTSLVPARHIARVYSIISMVDTAGAMFGGALLAGLFKEGMVMGGMGVGLPFYFIGGASGGFAGVLFAVGLRKGEGEEGA